MTIAELIAKRLATGLVHPGNPDANQPPMPIMLPVFRTAGMSPEMTELAERTATLIGEAIVALIETEGDAEIVPKAQLEEWRATLMPAEKVAVHCHCDRTFSNPLLCIDNRARVVVDGTRLLSDLARRSPACPHTVAP